MTIKVGVRKPIYPEWVKAAESLLSLEDKDQIVRCVIYALMNPIEGVIEIDEALQSLSNRIAILPTIKDALIALMVAESFVAWEVSQTRDDKIKYET